MLFIMSFLLLDSNRTASIKQVNHQLPQVLVERSNLHDAADAAAHQLIIHHRGNTPQRNVMAKHFNQVPPPPLGVRSRRPDVLLVRRHVAKRIEYCLAQEYQRQYPARDHHECVQKHQTPVNNQRSINVDLVHSALLARHVVHQHAELKVVMQDARIDVHEEENECLVVPPSHTVVDPVAVVVISIDALIASAAVVSTRCPRKAAVFAQNIVIHRPLIDWPWVG
jgi:hypothetical protein